MDKTLAEPFICVCECTNYKLNWAGDIILCAQLASNPASKRFYRAQYSKASIEESPLFTMAV
jgi:hypothetical protein